MAQYKNIKIFFRKGDGEIRTKRYAVSLTGFAVEQVANTLFIYDKDDRTQVATFTNVERFLVEGLVTEIKNESEKELLNG